MFECGVNIVLKIFARISTMFFLYCYVTLTTVRYYGLIPFRKGICVTLNVTNISNFSCQPAIHFITLTFGNSPSVNYINRVNK